MPVNYDRQISFNSQDKLVCYIITVDWESFFYLFFYSYILTLEREARFHITAKTRSLREKCLFTFVFVFFWSRFFLFALEIQFRKL